MARRPACQRCGTFPHGGSGAAWIRRPSVPTGNDLLASVTGSVAAAHPPVHHVSGGGPLARTSQAGNEA